jgi:hypothetical protein
MMSNAIIPSKLKAGNIVYLVPRTNTAFFTARVFLKEYP